MERLPYFDTHAHLDTEDFDADREALLQEIGSHMLGFINPGCDVRSSKASLAMEASGSSTVTAVPSPSRDSIRSSAALP